MKMAPAFLIYLLYLMLLTNVRAQLEKGEIAIFPGVWAVHFGFFALAMGLLYGPDVVRRIKYARYLRAKT